ncbi:MAG TPA: lysylphosphatidylglycerol synthase transmembrane domain-containing protein [Ktedonobacterales bacterium]|nr:lysylphosphatidylglycerol synthase transmembrane domain-containing protein [Ktedonobacterales bacterium]
MDSNQQLLSKSAAKSQVSSQSNRWLRFLRAAWPIAARAGVSALVLALWLQFSSIDLSQVVHILGHLRAPVLLGSLAAGIGAGAMAAAKWQLLLRAQSVHIGFFRVWQFNIIAGFYGLVLPGTESGNAVKALLLGRLSRRATGVWAAMLADQLNLLLAFALIAWAGVSFIATDAQLAGRSAWITGAGLTVAAVLLFHLLFLLPPVAAFIRRLLRPVSRLLRWRGRGAPAQTVASTDNTDASVPAPAGEEGWLARFWDGMAGYQHRLPTLSLATLLSCFYQGFLVLAAYQLALGLGIQVSYLNLLWIMTLVAIAQALPITFAGIGVRDVALTFFLGGLGVPGPAAIALSFAVLALNAALGLPGAVLQIFLPAPLPGESYQEAQEH